MQFPVNLIDIISKVSPVLGTALGGPIGSVVGSLISTALGGVDMTDTQKVTEALKNPSSVNKLKELEIQLTDLQNARLEASKEQGFLRYVRPILALAAMLAIVVDVIAIEYVESQFAEQILVVMLVVLVWDIRQIYRFYFGSGDDLPNIPTINKKFK